MGEGLRALVAARGALAVGIFNAWFNTNSTREHKREEWRRQTRLPAYQQFAQSVEELRHKSRRYRVEMIGGQAEPPDDPPDEEEMETLVRAVWQHLADVELVGPREVAEGARVLADAVVGIRFLRDEGKTVRDAFGTFRRAAQAAIDLPA